MNTIRKNLYRADIDGLRAIAVLAVVLFHIDPTLMPGGFIGVDIFFVISGFLITGNIIREHHSSAGFSLASFYRRRALRILPVLFVTVLAVLFVAQFLFLPKDLVTLSWTSLAAVFSAANIYFTYFLDVSYFADDSSLQPLLHLWSLGVEEQFYLLWPLVFLLILNRTKAWLSMLAVLSLIVASFVLAQFTVTKYPMFAYYMLPARAGQLLVGALLALYFKHYKHSLPEIAHYVLAILGASLIGYSLIFITEDLPFPGVNALYSTLGAAFIIWAGSSYNNLISRMLSLKPVVWIGLISYSLYMWHWPVVSFYKYMNGEVTLMSGLVLLAIMLALSVLSYYWIEKPTRRLKWNFTQTMQRFVMPSILGLVLIFGGMLATKGFGVYGLSDSYLNRLNALQPAPSAPSYSYVCQRSLLRVPDVTNPNCIINGKNEPSVLLWGDSNASHYVGMLAAFAEEQGFSFRNIAHSSCPPVFADTQDYVASSRADNCTQSLERVKGNIDQYDAVIISAAWDSYFRHSGFAQDFEDTLKALLDDGKKLIVLGRVPRVKNIDRSCEQKALKLLMPRCVEADEVFATYPEVNDDIKSILKSYPEIGYFDLEDALCVERKCSISLNGKLLYFDGGHLSMEGSWEIGRYILSKELDMAEFSILKSYSSKDSRALY